MTEHRARRYAALKIHERGSKGTDEVNRKLGMYDQIATVESLHPGRKNVRSILGTFLVLGPNGDHWCLVHEPLWESLESFQRASHPNSAKDVLKGLLSALDYLPHDCNVIHAGKCDPNEFVSKRDIS